MQVTGQLRSGPIAPDASTGRRNVKNAMKALALAACAACLVGVGAVAAQSGAPNAPLTGGEIQAKLFGVHLYGVQTPGGWRWDECIDPTGLTVFRVYPPDGQEAVPYSEEGRLEAVGTRLGLACFSYPPDGDPEPACFTATRRGDGYLFRPHGVEGGLFITTQVKRGVKSCPKPGDFIG